MVMSWTYIAAGVLVLLLIVAAFAVVGFVLLMAPCDQDDNHLRSLGDSEPHEVGTRFVECNSCGDRTLVSFDEHVSVVCCKSCGHRMIASWDGET